MSDDGDVKTISDVNLLIRTARRLFQETSRQPTAEEIAYRLSMPAYAVRRLLEIARRPVKLHS